MLDEARLQTEQLKLYSKQNKSQGSFEHVAAVCGEAVDKVMTVAMERESMDNLSVVIISFPNFTRYLESIEPQQGIGSQQRNRSQLHVVSDSMTPLGMKSPNGGALDGVHSSQPNIISSQNAPGGGVHHSRRKT